MALENLTGQHPPGSPPSQPERADPPVAVSKSDVAALQLKLAREFSADPSRLTPQAANTQRATALSESTAPTEPPTSPLPPPSGPAGPLRPPAQVSSNGGDRGRDGTILSPKTKSKGSSDGKSASVEGEGEFLPADQLETDLPSTPPGARAGRGDAAPPVASTAGRRWGIPPIRWGGEFSAGLQRSDASNGSSTASQVYETRLRASSYLIQPYIAQVAGDFALTLFRSQDGGGDAASANLTGTSLSGSGNLSVFPRSRFPFDATINLGDSRSAGSFSESSSESRRITLRQQYRPLVGRWFIHGSYDHSEITGNFGSDIVNRVATSYSAQGEEHTLNADGSLAKSENETGSTTNFFSSATHTYRYSDELSFNSSASLVDQETNSGFGRSSFSARASALQLYSFANWTPEESKWRGGASARYFESRSQAGAGTTDNKTVALNGSASYQATRNLSFNGGAGIASDLQGGSAHFESLSASYSGDPLQFGAAQYNWFTSINGANSGSSTGRSAQSFGTSLGHGLSRYWPMSTGINASLSFNQSISNSRSSGSGGVSSTSLNNSIGASLSAMSGDSLSGYLSATLSDNRTSGANESSFQQLNVQLSGNWRINPLSEFHSNLTWQLSRREDRSGNSFIVTDEFGRPVFIDESSQKQNSSLSGTAGYSHRRAFGVRNLRYRIDVRADTAHQQDNARRFGDAGALRPEDQASMDIDQRLTYSIGRFDTELQYRIAEIRGSRNSLIYIRASRAFGGF